MRKRKGGYEDNYIISSLTLSRHLFLLLSQAQEERKRESELLLEREAAECGLQQEEVTRLQRLIHATSSTTAATTAKVATYSTYKVRSQKVTECYFLTTYFWLRINEE